MKGDIMTHSICKESSSKAMGLRQEFSISSEMATWTFYINIGIKILTSRGKSVKRITIVSKTRNTFLGTVEAKPVWDSCSPIYWKPVTLKIFLRWKVHFKISGITNLFDPNSSDLSQIEIFNIFKNLTHSLTRMTDKTRNKRNQKWTPSPLYFLKLFQVYFLLRGQFEIERRL